MQNMNGPRQLLRLPEVLNIVGLSRSSFYENMALGIYPRPIRVGKRTIAWWEDEIYAALEARRGV